MLDWQKIKPHAFVAAMMLVAVFAYGCAAEYFQWPFDAKNLAVLLGTFLFVLVFSKKEN